MNRSLSDVITQRRSVRGFLPRPVDQGLLNEAFALAQRAPSNCNVQPWSVHVVSGATAEALRTDLRAAAAANEPFRADFEPGGNYRGVYRERQWDAAFQLYGALGVERRDRVGRREAFLANFGFFGAPHAAFVFLPDCFGVREAADCGMYAQTLMLALTERGIASCAQGALSMYPDLVRCRLGLDEHQKLLFGISFGYEDPEARANGTRVGRLPLDEAVRFHR